MNVHKKKRPSLTPENTKAWTLALYPAAVLAVVAFMVATSRPFTTELVAVLVALITGGSIQAAIKKNGANNAESDGPSTSGSRIRTSSSEKLEEDDRSGANNPDNWFHFISVLWRNKMGRVYPTSARI